MDRQEELRQWFEKADHDLIAAEYLATMHYPRPDEIICFHCQQAAEKYLKGFLFEKHIDPPRIHNLQKLLELCENINTEFSGILRQCSVLNTFSVIPRYPDEFQIAEDDVKKAMQYAAEVKDFVVKAREKSCS
jgi:HEPN domain-containing protein